MQGVEKIVARSMGGNKQNLFVFYAFFVVFVGVFNLVLATFAAQPTVEKHASAQRLSLDRTIQQFLFVVLFHNIPVCVVSLKIINICLLLQYTPQIKVLSILNKHFDDTFRQTEGCF